MSEFIYKFPERYSPQFFHYILDGGHGDFIMALPCFIWAQEHDFKDRFLVSFKGSVNFLYKEMLKDRFLDIEFLPNYGSHAKIFHTYNFWDFPRTNISKRFFQKVFGRTIPGKDLSLPKPKIRKPSENLLKLFKTNNENDLKKILQNSVVINTSYISPAKSWNVISLKETILSLLGKGYNVVLIGGKDERKIEGINLLVCTKSENKESLGIEDERLFCLVGKTSLEETLTVFQHSKYFISISGGMVQLAALSNIKILCLLTYADIYHSLYWREGEFAHDTWVLSPEEDKCRFCIDKIYLQQRDYNLCLLNKNYECREYDHKRIIQKFEMMENDIPCDEVENFKNNILPNLDF